MYEINIFEEFVLHCSKRRERGTEKSRRRARRSGSPPGSVRNSVKDQGKFHSAVSHDDTTEGALHWFQDESGNVYFLISGFFFHILPVPDV